jgi:hypothetical protein
MVLGTRQALQEGQVIILIVALMRFKQHLIIITALEAL